VNSFHQQISDVSRQSLEGLGMFRPELAICATIIALLLARMMLGRWLSAALVALLGSGVAFALACQDTWAVCCGGAPAKPVEIFGGMLVYDGFTTFFRTFLLAFTVLFVLVTARTGVPEREDGPDIYSMALGAVLGMCLMASANHLLMIFLGIEIASVPSYALSGLLKWRKESSEAALKFAVYGAGAAGVMLYGISLIAGITGTVHLPSMAGRVVEILARPAAQPSPDGTQLVLALAGLMIMVGLAFKLSAVPFHFWAPDVFEGAAAEIGGFLSVASKGAAVALLVRVALGFSFGGPNAAATHVTAAPTEAEVFQVAFPAQERSHGGAHAAAASEGPTENMKHRREVAETSLKRYVAYLIAFLAAITATFGNLAAYGQTNIKRLLAYSTIAHAGYMMMPVAAAVLLAHESRAGAAEAVGSVAFYVAMYLFMNLGAFTIVAILRNRIGSEQIDDYAGMLERSPGLVVCFSIILFSLVGLPPLAGFAAKFLIFGAVVDARMYFLVTIGVLNSVLSLFYYLRVIKVMVMSEAQGGREAPYLPMASLDGLYVMGLSLPVLFFGVFFDPVYHWAVEAAKSVF
jgi:NADH-quinone oxidoreductase subunit N